MKYLVRLIVAYYKGIVERLFFFFIRETLFWKRGFFLCKNGYRGISNLTLSLEVIFDSRDPLV
jgi:hypothetical protein